MKKRSLTIVILVILAVIIGVISVDVLNNRPDRRGSNPYALEVDQYREVDPALISHRESKNFSLGSLEARAMVLYQGKLYLVSDSSLLVLSTEGQALDRFPILPGAGSLWVEGTLAVVGHGTFVAAYDLEKKSLEGRWEDLGERGVITGIAANEEVVYVADAGNRQVVMYDKQGSRVGAFEGKAETEAGHGFIVPSANFDLTVNDFGELWVVNPGRHALENYSDEGRMRGYWQHASFDIEGFLGCCNPARISSMSEGRLLTSEKGLVRIKIYGPSGDLKSVVAPPDLFKEEGKAPDVCAQGEVVYALDVDRNMVRVFEPKSDE